MLQIGDFGKYGLLRCISKTNLTLGVNWYLAPDESHNADGKHITYLNNNNDRYFDKELFDILKDIIDKIQVAIRFLYAECIICK